MILLTLFGYYLLIGLLFAIGFFFKGYAAIAPEAKGASIATRLMWTPASVALWPYLLKKWIGKKS